ncbi:unnamed protein product [Parnassius mnemosyne]|uniref:CCHC-type domain-containing protein n=1 Tax=Parnassius mnemosyne TaxID=213953 RepID=A0AAV1KN22_9NEOP
MYKPTSGASSVSSIKTKSSTKSARTTAGSATLRKKVLMQNANTTVKEIGDDDTTFETAQAPSESSPNSEALNIEGKYPLGKLEMTEQDSDDNSSLAMDMEAELQVLGICKPVLRTDDEWSDADSVASVHSKRSSILPPAYKKAGISMDLATQRANEFLQSGKEALEKAGNMKKECKIEVHECLQGLYEVALSLSDSRSLHRLALEQERCRAAKELVRVERAHTKQIAELQSTFYQKLKEAHESIRETFKSAEAIRSWLNYEMDEPIKSIQNIQLELRGLATTTVPSKAALEFTHEQPAVTTETLMLLSRQIKEISEEINNLINKIDTLESRPIDIEQKLSPIKEQNTELIHRMDGFAENLHQTKEMVQNLPTKVQINTIPMEEQKKELRDAFTPLIELINRSNNQIEDLKECITAQMVCQGNSGIGTELALAEIKEKINDMYNRQSVDTQTLENKNFERYDQDNNKPQTTVDNKATRTRSHAEAVIQPKYSVILESIDPRNSSHDIITQVKNDVDLIELGSHLKNCKKLTVSTLPAKNPQLRLIGVATDLDDTKLIKAVIKENVKLLSDLEDEQKTIKVLRRTKSRIRELTNVIVETTPQMWAKLKEQKLRLGYQVVSCVDQSPVTQCYRCLGFNHTAKDCKNEQRCGYCSETHDTRECRNINQAPKCCNCIDSQKTTLPHPAYSHECPEWSKWDKIARSSVTYC